MDIVSLTNSRSMALNFNNIKRQFKMLSFMPFLSIEMLFSWKEKAVKN